MMSWTSMKEIYIYFFHAPDRIPGDQEQVGKYLVLGSEVSVNLQPTTITGLRRQRSDAPPDSSFACRTLIPLQSVAIRLVHYEGSSVGPTPGKQSEAVTERRVTDE